MRTRILEGEDLWALADVPGPFEGRRDVIAQLGNAQVLAVENTAGEILAYWPIWVAVHLEPLWIREDQRHHSTVARLLVEGMRAQLEKERITTAFAVIGHTDLATHLPMAARLGFERMPGDLFFLAGTATGVTDGSSSDSGDLPRRAVLHEPGEEQADQPEPERGDDGPPGLGD